MSNDANAQAQAIWKIRRAIVSRTLDALATLAYEEGPEIDDEIEDLQIIDTTRSPDIVITFTPGTAGDQTEMINIPGWDQPIPEYHNARVNEPTALTMVLRDTYRAEAHFHNPQTGELEPFALAPEDEKRLNHYAALTGRRNTCVCTRSSGPAWTP